MPAAGAMAASGQSLPCFFLHGVSAGAHLLLALAVAGRQLFPRRGKDTAVAGSGNDGAVGGFRCYGVAVCTTWALAAFELLLAAYSCYSRTGGAGWTLDAVADQADAASRAVAWLLLAAYLQHEFGRRARREDRFPPPLMLWCALFLLLSVLDVAVHAATSLDGLPVPANLWAHDAVSVLAAGVLLVAGLLGKREAAGSATEEPLLLDDTAGENNGADASAYASAGFLGVITFSWMSPLLAVGHKKTLGLDDVPDLDPGDCVAGLLPAFKSNLEALAGDGTTGQRVTAFKLTKVLVRTFRWHVAVTALYAVVYNVATYVGPYLINSLVQYLNGGDERPARKGQLLVLAFVAAKVFECLSQQHSCFRLQQVGIRARSALVAVVYEKGLALSCRSRQIHSSGEMINIVGVDADRVGNSSFYIHDLWLVPLQVGMALFVLYSNLGLASLAALGATVVVMLVNVPSGKVQEKFQQRLMGCKDVRMKATLLELTLLFLVSACLFFCCAYEFSIKFKLRQCAHSRVVFRCTHGKLVVVSSEFLGAVHVRYQACMC